MGRLGTSAGKFRVCAEGPIHHPPATLETDLASYQQERPGNVLKTWKRKTLPRQKSPPTTHHCAWVKTCMAEWAWAAPTAGWEPFAQHRVKHLLQALLLPAGSQTMCLSMPKYGEQFPATILLKPQVQNVAITQGVRCALGSQELWRWRFFFISSHS